MFVVGGVLLVPVPILLFHLMRSLGLTSAAAEDAVTLLVMLTVGGPHVFATYTRTLFRPGFAREELGLSLGGLAVLAIVAAAAVSSAFLDVTILGSPPIRFVLTFFFFWAGIHIVQQNSYCAQVYAARQGAAAVRGWQGWIDHAVMLLALYPASLFRMSMANQSDLSGATADPDAMATRIVVALGGSQQFADDYVFRIGRVAPWLPEFMRSPLVWIGVTAAFLACCALFAWKTLRERRAGQPFTLRTQLVIAMAVAGSIVPLFPNLDSAFQGMNAWHSFQYLGLLWLMNRYSHDRGELRTRFLRSIGAPGRHWRFYGVAVAGAFGLLALVLGTGWVIEVSSGGAFVMFGHPRPVFDPVTGRELYRPGAVLLAYYMVALGFLLVHYLHDGVFFFRTRYLTGPAPR